MNISQSEMDLLTREKTKKEKQLEEARSSLERVAQSYKGLFGCSTSFLSALFTLSSFKLLSPHEKS